MIYLQNTHTLTTNRLHPSCCTSKSSNKTHTISSRQRQTIFIFANTLFPTWQETKCAQGKGGEQQRSLPGLGAWGKSEMRWWGCWLFSGLSWGGKRSVSRCSVSSQGPLGDYKQPRHGEQIQARTVSPSPSRKAIYHTWSEPSPLPQRRLVVTAQWLSEGENSILPCWESRLVVE